MISPKCCGGNLIRPKVTEITINYISLQSMLDRKNRLKYMLNSQQWYKYHKSVNPTNRRVNSLINSVHFLEDCRNVVNIMKPVSKVLRLVDGDKKPTISFLHNAMRLIKDVAHAAYTSSKTYLKIIDKRWLTYFFILCIKLVSILRCTFIFFIIMFIFFTQLFAE